jgi:class 3 adenylate cyclase
MHRGIPHARSRVAGPLLAGACLFWLAAPLQAQAPTASPPESWNVQAIREVYPEWRFRAGDDPAWAAPDLDDSDWLPAPADVPWRRFAATPEGGMGWYRMRISVPAGPALGVGLRRVYDAAEIFVDGRQVASSGDPSARDPGPSLPFQGPVPADASADGEILVAIRVWSGLNPRNDGQISPPIIGPAESMRHYIPALTLERWRAPSGLPQVFLGLFLAGLGLVHGLIYFRRRSPEQGWFALAATVLGLHLSWQAAQAMGALDPTWIYSHFSILLRATAYAAMIAFGACLSEWPGRQLPRAAIGILLLAGLVGALQLPGPWWRLIQVAYGSAALVGLAMTFRGLRVGVRGIHLLLPGFLPLILWGLGDALDATLGLPAAYSSLRPWLTLLAIGMLSAGMSAALASRFADNLDELDLAYRASARFVPTIFLRLLGRSKITEVERGDSVALESGVMFCDIRDFSGLAEVRSPEQNFLFINAFLAAMEPCIHDHGGFIAQYLGDGFLALFPRPDPAGSPEAGDPESASSPIGAAVAMQAAMITFNRDRVAEGEPPVRIGIGLHDGAVMLGTIGGAARMDANVISDVVNTASRVEGLCKLYGAPVVVSESTLGRAGAETWEVQELDAVIVKGRSRPLRVFEILEGEPDAEARAVKRSEASAYAEALAAFRAGNLDRAEAGFAALTERAAAAGIFLERCAWYRFQGLPEHWDGVLQLEVK